jgi:phage N-6-adenine-methyltransferase
MDDLAVRRLSELETTIERGLKTFVEVGNALAEIRDSRLYRKEYATFGDYCRERWGMSKRHANRLVESASVIHNLGPMGPELPTSERQARPLTSLPPEQQIEAWETAVSTAPNGKLTAKHIESVVRSMTEVEETEEPTYAPVHFLEALLKNWLIRHRESVHDVHAAGKDSQHITSLGRYVNGLNYSYRADDLWQAVELVVSLAGRETDEPARPHVSNNSGFNEWYTPAEYIEAARRVLGTIDLDPASSQEANQVVKASAYYTINDDGLSQDWAGKVWLNPPYTANLIGRFASKAAAEYQSGRVNEAVILVNNATETSWFAALAEVSAAVCFLRSRVKFWRPDGETNSPLQGQAILYMGDRPTVFEREFSRLGWCARIQR